MQAEMFELVEAVVSAVETVERWLRRRDPAVAQAGRLRVQTARGEVHVRLRTPVG